MEIEFTGKKYTGTLILDDNVYMDIQDVLSKTCITSQGYAYVKGRRRKGIKDQLLHRVIYSKYVKTLQQNELIDHINGNKLDNRIENLRVATNRENQQNRRAHREGIRLVGTSFCKKSSKWRAQIWCMDVDNKPCRISLGSFISPMDAHLAYRLATEYILEKHQLNIIE